MLSGLNHLTLAVSQLAPSVAFLSATAGEDAARRRDGITAPFFSCATLAVPVAGPAAARHFAGGERLHHYAFQHAEADFALFAGRLNAAGVPVKTNKSEGASHYFLDPDGHKLELHVGNLAQRLAACRKQPIKVVFLARTNRRPGTRSPVSAARSRGKVECIARGFPRRRLTRLVRATGPSASGSAANAA